MRGCAGLNFTVMKTCILLLGLFVLLVFCSVGAWAVDAFRVTVDRRTFLRAIGEVESGGRDHAVGSAGERGRYQLTRGVWAQHTLADFKLAHRPGFAYAVAEKHFDWLLGGLLAADYPANVRFMAAAWNAGLSAVVNRRVPKESWEYADRVENLYEAMEAQKR